MSPLKKKTAFLSLCIASLLMLAAPFVPHHHHGDLDQIPCYVSSHCPDRAETCSHSDDHSGAHRHCTARHNLTHLFHSKESRITIAGTSRLSTDRTSAPALETNLYYYGGCPLSLFFTHLTNSLLKGLPRIELLHLRNISTCSPLRGAPCFFV